MVILAEEEYFSGHICVEWFVGNCLIKLKSVINTSVAVMSPHTISDSDLESVIAQNRGTELKARRSSNESKYKCSISDCGATFKRLDHLDRHEYHHTGVRKHVCFYDGCDKAYSIVTHLKRHLRTTHERTNVEKQKTIKCTVTECVKMFSTDNSMRRHVREAHENPKVYACNHCDAKFSKKLKMRRHEISKHTLAFPFTCSKCGRGFHQGWQNEKHMLNCKVYSCTNCNEKFEKWSQYLKHCREMNHGCKYYNCEHCTRSYKKESDLKKHTEMKHSSYLIETFVCTEPNCSRSYAYERNLRQHVQTAHAGKRFQCSEKNCGREFTSSQNLEKHLVRGIHGPELKNSSTKDSTKAIKTKKNRKKRKDAGQSVTSNLVKLAGLEVDKSLNNSLRLREINSIKTVSNALQYEQIEQDSVSDSQSETFINVLVENKVYE